MLCYTKQKKYKSYLWPLLLLKPFHLSCKYNNWNAATSKQSKQQNACKDYIHPLNNKTTVTYVIMQTTQKDSFFFNNWFIIWNIWGYGIRSFRFSQKSFWYELKQWNFAKSLITSKKVCLWTRKHFGWILINFKSSMWNYLLKHT